MDIELEGILWRIMNIYVPNNPKGIIKFWEECEEKLVGKCGVLVGNFNMVLNVEDSIPNKLPKLSLEGKLDWDGLVMANELRDMGKSFPQLTWSNKQKGEDAI